MEVAARLPGAAPEQRPGALLPGAGEEVDRVGGEGQAEEPELLLASLASVGAGETGQDHGLRGRRGEQRGRLPGLQRAAVHAEAATAPALESRARAAAVPTGREGAPVEPRLARSAALRLEQEVQAPQQLGARPVEGVEGADPDQRLGLVAPRGGALEEVRQGEEGPLGGAALQQPLEGRLAQASRAPQSHAQGQRPCSPLELEPGPAAVHVGAEDPHAQAPRLLHVDAARVVAGLAEQERRQERSGVVRLQPGRAIGEAAVGDRVGLAEGEGREPRQPVPERRGLVLGEALGVGSGHEALPQRSELVEAPLLQGPAQLVGLGELEPRDA